MATSKFVQHRIAELARQLVEEMGEIDPSLGVCWLDAVENQAVEIGDALQAEVVRLQAESRSNHPDEAACPQCGESGRFQRLRDRELTGRRGPLRLAEPEYYCSCCRKAFFPLDPGHRR